MTDQEMTKLALEIRDHAERLYAGIKVGSIPINDLAGLESKVETLSRAITFGRGRKS